MLTNSAVEAWISRSELAAWSQRSFFQEWSLKLVRELPSAAEPEEFLRAQLSEIHAEYAAQSSQLWMRLPEWTKRGDCGRTLASTPDSMLLSDALDREAAAICAPADGVRWIVLPLVEEQSPPAVLLIGGKSLERERAPELWHVARLLFGGLQVIEDRRQRQRFGARLRETLNVAVTFAMASDTETLLHTIAEQATRILDCDRASIFLWDKEQRVAVAVPALGIDGETLRIPDNKGIVGEVIQTSKTIIVDDAYADARFNQLVDKASGYKTDTLLCCPLRHQLASSAGAAGTMIGAFEVINKNDGGRFTQDDAEILTLLGVQAANALQQTRQREQLIRSRQNLEERVVSGVQIVGDSLPISSLRNTIERLAPTDLPVLILGESGTGKEVVSQALHYRGPRKDQPFVAVNCAALAESLLESELFGHEKGAFTDAHEARQGKFELAEGGTLFLDEIGDMSPGGQAKLLRVLEQKVITRVGGSRTIPTNVRVIAATNSKLADKVKEGRFRQDLYYRLSVVTIDIPPLRDRPEDILPLAEYFLKQFCRQANRAALVLSMDARRRLQAHHWPGNIRELRNLMERVAFLAAGPRVEVEDLAFILSAESQSGGLNPSEDLPLDDATKHFQRDFIRRGIKRVQDNMSEAARLLGVHRSNLYRKMKQLDMQEVGGAE